MNTFNAYNANGDDFIWSIIFAVCCIPACLGGFIFLLFLIKAFGNKEDGDSKQSLARAQMLSMLTMFAWYTVAIVYAVLILPS